jgi:hypothetical protein
MHPIQHTNFFLIHSIALTLAKNMTHKAPCYVVFSCPVTSSTIRNWVCKLRWELNYLPEKKLPMWIHKIIQQKLEDKTQLYYCVCVCMCLCVCVYIYIYTHTHTHIILQLCFDFTRLLYNFVIWLTQQGRRTSQLPKHTLMCNEEETLVLPLEVKDCKITTNPFVPELNNLCTLKKMEIWMAAPASHVLGDIPGQLWHLATKWVDVADVKHKWVTNVVLLYVSTISK